VLQLFCS